jgi:outer membrane protein OmpA-like peptidoglycan-associated protein
VTFLFPLRALALLSLAAFILLGSGCGKDPETEVAEGGDTADLNFIEPPAPDSPFANGTADSLGLDPLGTGIPQADALRIAPAGMISELNTIYFDFDSYQLSESSAVTLDGNAAWLLSNPNVHVQIEGHCDDKGTIEYNLNLGQLRADMVREYLVLAGVSADRLHTISYGEERPLGSNESQNRRVQFLVYDPNSM